MGRGLFSGIVWGLVVGLVAIVGATQLVDRQELSLPRPEQASTEVPDATEFAEVREESDPIAPEPEEPALKDELAAAAPVQPRAESDAAPTLDAAPVAVPVPEADAPQAPAAPDTPTAPTVASAPDAELPGRGDVASPGQPESDAPLAAGIEAPAAPAPAPEPVEETVVSDAPATDDPPAVPQEEDTASAEAAEAPDAPVVPDVAEEQPEVAALPETADEEPRQPEPPETSEDVAVLPGDAAEAVPDTADDTETSMPGQRAGTLPGIGTAQGDTAEDVATPEPDVAADDSDGGPALDSFRVAFERPEDVPLVSLILILPDVPSVNMDTLDELPFAVSYAVNAAAPNAAELARDLRASGSEILMIPSLPKGATPADVEQALQANLSVIPEAIAFLDAPEASFQSDRTAVAQVVAAAGASGHGLVTFPRGLNTAQQIAERDGVPSALVFRDLDGDGQDGAAIRRTLDQAAFRARQEGEVILVGRAQPETITALTEWALGNRAASVTLAPVSAVIAPQS